jgi:hypothetical protein
VKRTNPFTAWLFLLGALAWGTLFAAPAPPPTRFTLAVIPDSQQEVLKEEDNRLANRLQWLVDHRQELNLKMVLHVGDLMNWDTPDHAQYQRASNALCILDQAAIPFACALGNHDTAAVKVGGSAAPGNVNSNLRITTSYNAFFPVSRFKALEATWQPGQVDTACHVFQAGGLDWIVINLELWARTGAVQWAKQMLDQHPRHQAIILTHSHLNAKGDIEPTKGGYGDNSPEYIFDRLRNHANVRLVFSGHTGNQAYRTDPGPRGEPIHQFLQCYHDTSNPVRLVEIDPAQATLKTWVYSPAAGAEKADHSRLTLTNLTWLKAVE